MAKALVLVPFAMDESGVANRRAQLTKVKLGPDIEFDFRPVTAGPELFMSPHDFVLMDLAIFEAGLSAQEDGYDAVCIDTMSDSGLDALRSVLDIPVISPGKASMLFALMLGNKFALLAQWEPAVIRSRKFVSSLGLSAFCAAIENYLNIEVPKFVGLTVLHKVVYEQTCIIYPIYEFRIFKPKVPKRPILNAIVFHSVATSLSV